MTSRSAVDKIPSVESAESSVRKVLFREYEDKGVANCGNGKEIDSSRWEWSVTIRKIRDAFFGWEEIIQGMFEIVVKWSFIFSNQLYL